MLSVNFYWNSASFDFFKSNIPAFLKSILTKGLYAMKF